MFEGQVEANGKKFEIKIEWSGKRGTYNQWWRTWSAEIVDGKVPPTHKVGSNYWNDKDWKPLCGCVEVGYRTPYPLENKAQVLAALGAG